MNFSEMPVEIWADLLEEQGEDTTELREWIAGGLQVSESDFYCSHDHSSGDGNGSGDGSGHGHGYGRGYGNGNGYGSGDGYDYGYGHSYGSGYGDGSYGSGIDYDDNP